MPAHNFLLANASFMSQLVKEMLQPNIVFIRYRKRQQDFQTERESKKKKKSIFSLCQIILVRCVYI